MIHRIAEYMIREGELEPVLAAIAAFVSAVRVAEPETRYDAWRRGDSLSFLHVMAFVDTEAMQRHQKASYTAAFASVLYPRCVEPPRFTDLHSVEGA